MDGVIGAAEFVSEVADTGRQPLRVMEQQHLSHFRSLQSRSPDGSTWTILA